MRFLAPAILVAALLLGPGCLQAQDGPPPPGGPSEPECPVAAPTQEATINTPLGQYNVSTPVQRPYSDSYDEFEWDWPADNLIAMDVRAEWDAGILGERTMQLRVENLDGWERMAVVNGQSPIVVNITTRVPEEGRWGIMMTPVAETAGMPGGVTVNKESFDTHITMVQTLLCEP